MPKIKLMIMILFCLDCEMWGHTKIFDTDRENVRMYVRKIDDKPKSNRPLCGVVRSTRTDNDRISDMRVLICIFFSVRLLLFHFASPALIYAIK